MLRVISSFLPPALAIGPRRRTGVNEKLVFPRVSEIVQTGQVYLFGTAASASLLISDRRKAERGKEKSLRRCSPLWLSLSAGVRANVHPERRSFIFLSESNKYVFHPPSAESICSRSSVCEYDYLIPRASALAAHRAHRAMLDGERMRFRVFHFRRLSFARPGGFLSLFSVLFSSSVAVASCSPMRGFDFLH